MKGRTDEQRRAFEDAGRELPARYYALCAAVALAILGAIGVVLGPWGFAVGPTL